MTTSPHNKFIATHNYPRIGVGSNTRMSTYRSEEYVTYITGSEEEDWSQHELDSVIAPESRDGVSSTQADLGEPHGTTTFSDSEDDIENLEAKGIVRTPTPEVPHQTLSNESSSIELYYDGSQLVSPAQDIVVLRPRAGSIVSPLPLVFKVADTEFLLVPYLQSDIDCSHLVSLYDTPDILELTLEEFFGSIRSHEDLNEIVKFDVANELVLTVPAIDLCITEDDVYSRYISINDFVKAIVDMSANTKDESVVVPDRIILVLSYQTRFITKFNKLTELIREGHGFEQLKSTKRPGQELPQDDNKRRKI